MHLHQEPVCWLSANWLVRNAGLALWVFVFVHVSFRVNCFNSSSRFVLFPLITYVWMSYMDWI